MTDSSANALSIRCFDNEKTEGLELSGGDAVHPLAVPFYNECFMHELKDLFPGILAEKLFETSFLRDEGDSDQKYAILGSPLVTILLRTNEQRDGSLYVTGELLAHGDEPQLRDDYRALLLLDVLADLAEPLESTLKELALTELKSLLPGASDILRLPQELPKIHHVRCEHRNEDVFAIVEGEGFSSHGRLPLIEGTASDKLRQFAQDERERAQRILKTAARAEAAAAWLEANPIARRD